MKEYFSLIKFSHTIFALPFALLGFFIAVQETGKKIDWGILILIVLCMVFARSAAMAYNRYLDRDIDLQNPRTATREIPSGVISAKAALTFVVLNGIAFVITTWFINRLCFFLSPVALIVILGYSYTKRFTFLCHFVLGLGLALAPIGAYLAVLGRFDVIPLLYSIAVLVWVSGFDIIYALQDEAFDKAHHLQSVPVKLGRVGALRLSNLIHIICGLTMILAAYLMAGRYPSLLWLHWLGVAIFVILLYYQHHLVKPNDLSKINLAFFTTNGIASFIFSALVILDFYY